MKKSTVAKWIIASVAVTAVAAFVAGVAFELRAIRKLTVDIDNDEEPQADDLLEEEVAPEVAEEVAEEVVEEA
ncbi:MAG: hypothetical protein E7584_03995 [Ruminococcaceae bacterium]|nr:hypothetical protein [Oscillospiraceae bacterium]